MYTITFSGDNIEGEVLVRFFCKAILNFFLSPRKGIISFSSSSVIKFKRAISSIFCSEMIKIKKRIIF